MKKYSYNLLLSLDQFINALLGGDPDETISSRLGKWAKAGKNSSGLKKPIYDIANFIVEMFEKDHFNKSIEEDEGKDQSMEE